MTLRHQVTTDVLADVVTDKNQRGEIATTKFPKRPPSLRPRAKGDHIAPAGTIIDESLAVPKLGVTGFKRVGERDFTNRSTVNVVDLTLIHTGSLSLPELALWKWVNRHTASGRKKPAIELKGATGTFILRTHESNGEVGHMDRISRIIGLASRRRSNGGQEAITESAQLESNVVLPETGKAKTRRRKVEPANNFKDQVPSEEGTDGNTGAPVPRGRGGQGGTGTNEGETPGIGEERKADGDVQSKRGRVRNRSSLGRMGSAEKLYKPS
jgi:hypothetical protein